MTAVKSSDVDRALRRLDPSVDILLFYGPDGGLVSERARLVAESKVDDPSDPFQLIRLDGDTVADQPARLVEEISTFALFSGPRVILVRGTSRNITPAVSTCLDVPSTGTLVIIEAGNLAKGAPLRALCESSARALALPCYADEARDLGTVIDETLAQAALKIAPDAREMLLASIGADRLATRSELQKLALYAHGREHVTAEDVEAVVSDVSAQSTDLVLDSAFLGNMADLDSQLTLLAQRGTASASLAPLGLRHGLSLLAARLMIDGGQSADAALQSWRGLNFRRRDHVKRQLRTWTAHELRGAAEIFQSTSLDTRRMPGLAGPLLSAALLRIARKAQRLSAR